MVEKLTQGGVEFVLVGGYAAAAHGSTLLTRDVDICCRFSQENLRRLHSVLGDIHPRHRMTPEKLPFELNEELMGRLKNLYRETDLCVLDCLSEVAGVGDYDQVLSQSIEIQTAQGKLRVLDIEALIRAKEAMNRPHDQIAVKQLKHIKELRRQKR